MSTPLGAHDIFANEVWKCHSGLECKVKRNVKLNLKMIEITEF